MGATATKPRPTDSSPPGPSREAILRHVEILKHIRAPREAIEIAERVAASAPTEAKTK